MSNHWQDIKVSKVTELSVIYVTSTDRLYVSIHVGSGTYLAENGQAASMYHLKLGYKWIVIDNLKDIL